MTQTYFFDVTDIMDYVRTETSVSGIQRVSLAVITRMIARFGSERVKIAFWSEKGRYEALDADVLLQMDDFDANALAYLFFGEKARWGGEIAPSLERYRTRPFKRGVYRWVRNFHATLGNDRHFRKKGTSLSDWRNFHAKRREFKQNPPLERPKAQLVRTIAKPGDWVIVMGAVSGQDKLAQALADLKSQKGVGVTILIHDLIPILAPEHMHGGFSHRFDRWLRQSASYCQSYLANSIYTKKDLKEFLEKEGTPRPIKVVPLAQYFERPALSDDPQLSAQIKDVLQNPYVLVVGTMETRKNLMRLALAWEQLSLSGEIEMPRLVFAGKQNWHRQDFNNWLEKNQNLGGLIEVIDRPSDTELTMLYEGCLFTAMVSEFEGWGLPVGESLSMGKTGVVSDNTSMPEVGGDMVEYCDPYDVGSIAEACQKLIQDPKHRSMLEARIRHNKLRTWDDVTEDFVQFFEDEASQKEAG